MYNYLIAEKCKRTIKGCESQAQLKTALNFCLLAKKQYYLSQQDCIDIQYFGYWKHVTLRKYN